MLHLGTATGARTTATTAATTATSGTTASADEPRAGAPAAPEPCDLVTVPARQGLEAVDILRRGADQEAVGPVIHDGACATLGFLVPPGTAQAWDVPGSACTQTDGRGLRIPAEPPVSGSGWLLPPADDTPVTDPAVLRAALDQAARLIEAADNCR
ncbi:MULTISPECIES: hypothetical protein [unclassified Streptomyces]|uniref:hypothetical protein n=1 Tax=unclassified Streptomyces TaxID=2593676 RepID=UPI00225C1D90|nr:MULTISPECIES: hypothetical protein [unclassified Streptomyces]MCX5140424.1 hypothetical protein [Streptomyces sp. NBC_00338]WRZ64977.1 hypothetical protein OG408_14275 [Streptomyces sp. NBC_01257]WSU58977.1 hypothetical protein OG450_14415 [Streptomyces sp. NBC_01104]